MLVTSDCRSAMPLAVLTRIRALVVQAHADGVDIAEVEAAVRAEWGAGAAPDV